MWPMCGHHWSICINVGEQTRRVNRLCAVWVVFIVPHFRSRKVLSGHFPNLFFVAIKLPDPFTHYAAPNLGLPSRVL